jgi:hypothetical protein
VEGKREVPEEIESVQRRFEQWRQTRRGRGRIPDRLWVAAAGLARANGVHTTSRALGLDFNKLKALASRKNSDGMKESGAPQFLELVPPSVAAVGECVIELESPRGKMRVEWKGPVAPDLAGMSRMLWGRE